MTDDQDKPTRRVTLGEFMTAEQFQRLQIVAINAMTAEIRSWIVTDDQSTAPGALRESEE